jgi:DNA-binding MarR family transcriptional regulator
MGLARQNVQRLADALEKDGIIEYAVNPDHKRAKLVCLTKRGRKIMNDLDALQITWANGVTDKIPAAEIQAACELIKKLRSRLEKSRLTATAPGTRFAR